MLQVLTAQIVAEERERAIQRRLQEAAVRREAVAAQMTRRPPAIHDPAVHTAGLRCNACRPSAVGAC